MSARFIIIVYTHKPIIDVQRSTSALHSAGCTRMFTVGMPLILKSLNTTY